MGCLGYDLVMARTKAQVKKAKAEYSRKYRREHPEKVQAYNRRTVQERASRNKARAEVEKKVGKKAIQGKEIHHVDSNPMNNSKKNLAVAKKGHGGGTGGPNQNARKRAKKKK